MRVRDRHLRIVSALNLQERVTLVAGGATLVATAFLWVIGDVNWLLPLAITVLYVTVAFGTWNRAEHRQAHVLGDERSSERTSVAAMQPALSVAYWSFFMILLGLTMTWAAVSQLTSHGGTVFSVVLLTIGVALIVVAVFVMAAMLRHKSK